MACRDDTPRAAWEHDCSMEQHESTDDTWRKVFNDASILIEHVPSPLAKPTGEWSRTEQTDAYGVAVAWGWLMRTKRTAEAALILHSLGYAVEEAPLDRSVIEHTVRLQWAAERGRQEFVEVMLRNQKASLDNIITAAKSGVPLTIEQLAKIEALQSNAGDEFKSLDYEAAFAHVIERLPHLTHAHQVWLLKSRESHPSLTSASPYSDWLSSEPSWQLYLTPKTTPTDSEMLMTAMLCTAALAYGIVAGLNAYFDEELGRLDTRISALLAQRARPSEFPSGQES